MLMQRIKTTEDLLKSSVINHWCYEGSMAIYLVKSVRVGELITSNIYNKRRSDNVCRLETHKVTGTFRTFMDRLEDLSRAHNYTHFRFSSIVNEFLPDVLARRGYTVIRTGYANEDIDMILKL